MVLSIAFPMKLMKRNGKLSHSNSFNHPHQQQGEGDDASSLEMTVSLDDDSSSFNQSDSARLCSSSNSVSFAMHLNEVYENDKMVKSELHELWYQPTEYQTFRAMALEASQQIIATEKRNRAPHSYQRVLERTFAACCNYVDETSTDQNEDDMYNDNDEEMSYTDSTNSNDSGSNIELIFQQQDETIKSKQSVTIPSVLSVEDFVHLQRWLEVGSSRIGLEKWSIRTVSVTRSARRDAIMESIMSVQQQVQYATRFPSSKKDIHHKQKQQKWSDSAEFIRGTSERLSRPSCLFCLVMAQALAAAVHKENIFDTL
jgi:hypothetical protein